MLLPQHHLFATTTTMTTTRSYGKTSRSPVFHSIPRQELLFRLGIHQRHRFHFYWYHYKCQTKTQEETKKENDAKQKQHTNLTSTASPKTRASELHRSILHRYELACTHTPTKKTFSERLLHRTSKLRGSELQIHRRRRRIYLIDNGEKPQRIISCCINRVLYLKEIRIY
jgi:hypothetical protein